MICVNELYRTIQGESTYVGFPCVFVRLAGCNLRCSYCDTRYAYDKGFGMTVQQITERVLSYKTPLAAVTGGEPLYQAEASALLDELSRRLPSVLLETNGAFLLPLDRNYTVVMDVKSPGSGEEGAFEWRNLKRLQTTDELKLVLTDRRDFEWAVDFIRTQGLEEAPNPILFSPAAGRLAPPLLAKWILDTDINVRLQLQVHRMLWPDQDRGV